MELTASITEGVIVVGEVVIKAEAGVGASEKLNLHRLADEWAILNAPNFCTKASSLAMMSLKYVGKKNDLPLRVPMWGKG